MSVWISIEPAGVIAARHTAYAAARPDNDDQTLMALIAVHDQGGGISEEQFSRLFKRYARGRERRGEGLGLGLYLSREFVARHGGDIWAESREGQGSTFYVALPLENEHSNGAENTLQVALHRPQIMRYSLNAHCAPAHCVLRLATCRPATGDLRPATCAMSIIQWRKLMHFKDYIANLPPYKPPKLIRQQPAGVVKLSSNENPLGPSPRALAAIQAAAAQCPPLPRCRLAGAAPGSRGPLWRRSRDGDLHQRLR